MRLRLNAAVAIDSQEPPRTLYAPVTQSAVSPTLIIGDCDADLPPIDERVVILVDYDAPRPYVHWLEVAGQEVLSYVRPDPPVTRAPTTHRYELLVYAVPSAARRARLAQIRSRMPYATKVVFAREMFGVGNEATHSLSFWATNSSTQNEKRTRNAENRFGGGGGGGGDDGLRDAAVGGGRGFRIYALIAFVPKTPTEDDRAFFRRQIAQWHGKTSFTSGEYDDANAVYAVAHEFSSPDEFQALLDFARTKLGVGYVGWYYTQRKRTVGVARLFGHCASPPVKAVHAMGVVRDWVVSYHARGYFHCLVLPKLKLIARKLSTKRGVVTNGRGVRMALVIKESRAGVHVEVRSPHVEVGPLLSSVFPPEFVRTRDEQRWCIHYPFSFDTSTIVERTLVLSP